jgi:hypothetical protein
VPPNFITRNGFFIVRRIDLAQSDLKWPGAKATGRSGWPRLKKLYTIGPILRDAAPALVPHQFAATALVAGAGCFKDAARRSPELRIRERETGFTAIGMP